MVVNIGIQKTKRLVKFPTLKFYYHDNLPISFMLYQKTSL